MQDYIGAAQGTFDGKRVGDVSDDKFSLPMEIGGTLALRTMNWGERLSNSLTS